MAVGSWRLAALTITTYRPCRPCGAAFGSSKPSARALLATIAPSPLLHYRRCRFRRRLRRFARVRTTRGRLRRSSFAPEEEERGFLHSTAVSAASIGFAPEEERSNEDATPVSAASISFAPEEEEEG